MKSHPAKPLHSVGDVVSYFDRQTRRQSGEILYIEATWAYKGRPPMITYTVRHPTYRNRLAHIGAEKISTQPTPERTTQ